MHSVQFFSFVHSFFYELFSSLLLLFSLNPSTQVFKTLNLSYIIAIDNKVTVNRVVSKITQHQFFSFGYIQNKVIISAPTSQFSSSAVLIITIPFLYKSALITYIILLATFLNDCLRVGPWGGIQTYPLGA